MPTQQYQVAAISASGSNSTLDLGVVEGHGAEMAAVGEAQLVSHTAQAAQGGTNFATLQLGYSRGGAATVLLGSAYSLGTNALVADVPVSLSLGSDQEKARLQSGDVLQLVVTQAGTGGAVPASILELETE